MTHKADHFYNFCITAHSLRDHLLEHLGKITNADRQPFHEAWAGNPTLVAVAEIANSTKHFQLRDNRTMAVRAAKTKRTRQGVTSRVDVFTNAAGDVRLEKRSAVPTYYVEVKNGDVFELYAFMDAVAKHWATELRRHGIRLRRQPWRRLSGSAT